MLVANPWDAQQGINLEGFSKNSGHWDQANDGAWSDHPVQPGPKAGFHDPIVAAPVREDLVPTVNMSESSDDSTAWPFSLDGGTL